MKKTFKSSDFRKFLKFEGIFFSNSPWKIIFKRRKWTSNDSKVNIAHFHLIKTNIRNNFHSILRSIGLKITFWYQLNLLGIFILDLPKDQFFINKNILATNKTWLVVNKLRRTLVLYCQYFENKGTLFCIIWYKDYRKGGRASRDTFTIFKNDFIMLHLE